jgi:hypothetical protein
MTKGNRLTLDSMYLSVTVHHEDIAAAYAELGWQRGCLQGRSEDDPMFEQLHNKVMEYAVKRALDELDKLNSPQGKA